MTANRFNQVTTRTTPPAAVASAATKPAAFTLRLTPAEAAAVMEDESRLLIRLGQRPSRSDIIKALLGILHEDESLFDEVARRLTP